MRLMIIAFVIGMFMFGCTQELMSSSNKSSNISSNQIGISHLINEWKTYNQTTFSFNYPNTLNVTDSLGSYGNGSGYAVILMQNQNVSNPTIIVYYIRHGNSSALGEQATQIAYSFLESDNRGTDMLGILHRTTGKGSITNFTTTNGYAGSEMTFSMTDTKTGNIFTGYAIQIYDPVSKIAMKARIMSLYTDQAKQVRDKFVETVKVG